MRNYLILLIGLVSLSFFSCISEEGEGGTSVIQGKVFKVLHPDDVYNFVADTFPAAKEDVFIVFGDEPIYGDKMETGPDGFFRFKYLTKGTYIVYAYSTTPDGRKVAVYDTVTTDSGETKELQTIYIHEGKSLNKSYIKGTVLVKYYDKGFITGLIPANEVRVYLRVKDAPYHTDEIRTGSDGVFMFQNLDPGVYEVFVLSEQAGAKVLTPIIKTVTIQEKGIIETIATPFEIIINA